MGLNNPSLTAFLYISVAVAAFLLTPAWGDIKKATSVAGTAKLSASMTPSATVNATGTGSVNQSGSSVQAQSA